MLYGREKHVHFTPGLGNNRTSNVMALAYHLSSWYPSLLKRYQNLVLWAWVKFTFPVRVANSRTTNEVTLQGLTMTVTISNISEICQIKNELSNTLFLSFFGSIP